MMKSQLTRLEKRIEELIEGSIGRLLGVDIHPTSVASQIASTMGDGIRYDDDGNSFAPDQYALTFFPEDVEILLDQAPGLHNDLAEGLLDAARASSLQFAAEPNITLAADPTLSKREIRVIAWHSSNPLEFTQTMPREPKTQPGKMPGGAFLVISGDRHFALVRPVVNIGRRLDNQLILDDPHVSRTHAQLRVREGQFVLFDLGSTAGTRVNNHLIKQHILQPGDVIAIASKRLVYGEDPGGLSDETTSYSAPFPPRPAGDQRTISTKRDKKI